MESNPIPLSVVDTIQIANIIVKFFNLNLKVIEFGENKCDLKCYENKVSDKEEILMELIWEKNCIMVHLLRNNTHKYAIFKEEFEYGENIYSIAIVSSDINKQEKTFYIKEVKNGFSKYNIFNEEKYVDSEISDAKKFKCRKDCIKKELF